MTFRRGSTGQDVRRIQQRLQELNLYRGPIDGSFGGGTESAAKSFQKAHGLAPDGIVGPLTWERLFPAQPMPVLDLLQQPVAQRCLALTGAFETGASVPDCFGGLSGDFDGQGLSLGVLQWNLGQGSLQPLLQQMVDRHRQVLEDIFHEQFPIFLAMILSPQPEQMAWARSIQDTRRFQVLEPWRGLLKSLCRTPEFQAIQVRHASRIHDHAVELCTQFDLTTERAVALMFDILVQNGSISLLVKAQIQKDVAQMGKIDDPLQGEVARMRIIANQRAAACRPEYVEDVRRRKLTIAEGKGTVHDIYYDLEEQFGLRLKAFAQPAAEPA
jgi:hypothetical protein